MANSLKSLVPEAGIEPAWPQGPLDFETDIVKVKKCYNYNRLILFHFFFPLLVSFGNI